MNKTTIALFVAALMAVPATSSAKLLINEIMQSNIDALYVEKEFPDSWVEIYNPDDEPVSVNGYKIGTSAKPSKAYSINSLATIPPKGHLLIYCDKNADGLHTDFRLESSKEATLYLFDVSGNEVDKLTYKKMPAPNVSYARRVDGGSEWGYAVSATPGSSNSGLVSVEASVTPEPEFSMPAGLYTEAVSVVVSIPANAPADVKLCVTTDGREPQLTDAVSGTSATYTLTSSTGVRARLISPSMPSGVSTTRSYIFHSRGAALPIVSITIDPDYLYSADDGIFYGELDQNPNWDYEWRRPMNIEFFAQNTGNLQFSQLCETRVKGGWSRRYAQKSLVLYANKRFGVKTFLTEGVWRDKPTMKETKSIELRNSGNDFEGAHIRDAFAQRLIGLNSPNVDWQAYEPVVCYINGQYKGIYDLRERSNEDFVAANYNGLEDIDLIENWSEVKVGTIDALDSLRALYNRADMTFARLAEQIDIENFMDMFAFQTFAGNTDWPHNNIVCWRPTADGSKWRWILKDIDRFAITWEAGQHTHDFLQFVSDMATSGDPGTQANVKLFKRIFDNAESRRMFVDRLSVFMGDFLHSDYALPMLSQMTDEISPEYSDHCNVYFGESAWWRANQQWPGEINFIKEWIPKRRAYLYERMGTFFNLGTLYSLTIDRAGQEASVNGVLLTQPKFDGQYYLNSPLTLTTAPGYHWVATIFPSSGRARTEVSRTETHTFNFSDARSVRLVLEARDPSSIDANETSTPSFVNVNGLTITSLNSPATVLRPDGSIVAEINENESAEMPSSGIYIVVRHSTAKGEQALKVVCR